MKTIKAEAPTRIDLAGGTLDLPPLYLFHPQSLTVNAAIDVKARVTISAHERVEIVSRDQNETALYDSPEDISWQEHPRLELILRLIQSFQPALPMRVEVTSEAPAGSGLGGSSVIAIALTAALARWYNRPLSPEELVEHAKSIETQTIRVPTGYQDYWGAVYGGLHAYEMGLNGKLQRTPLGSKAFLEELQRHLLLVYVGVPHFSGANNWELFKRHIDGDAATVAFFERLKDNALAMKAALLSADIRQVAAALNRDWETRRAMLPTMTTPEIDRLIAETFQAGAFGARVCGAGAGGCTVLLINPDRREALTALVQQMEMQVLPANIAGNGVAVHEAIGAGSQG